MVIEVLNDLFEEFPKDGTDFSSESVRENIASFCSNLINGELYTINLPLTELNLYRVRYDETFDITDLSQFGYIQDRSGISRRRYNLPEEQVLYTATHPYVAYREIEYEDAPCYFFLSIWRKKPEYKNDFKIYAVFPSDFGNVKGNAANYRRALDLVYSKMTINQKWAHSLGQYLEAPKECWPNQEYILSSLMAHYILMYSDALLTVSQKSDNSELNITFNKAAADNVELVVIYRCKSLDYSRDHNKTELLYDVDYIGIQKDSRIEWHSFRIIPSSITSLNPINGQDAKTTEVLAKNAIFAKHKYDRGNQPDNFKISVQQNITDFIKVCAVWDNISVVFMAKIELVSKHIPSI